jgi:hypothetical protein
MWVVISMMFVGICCGDTPADTFFPISYWWGPPVEANRLENWKIITEAGYRTPNREELFWQTMASLAYGVRGVLYFYYWPPEERGPGIVDKAGIPTPVYRDIQTVNSEISRLGKHLVDMKLRAVYHSLPLPPGTREIPESFPFQFIYGGPIIVSEFESSSGMRYYLFVNRDYRSSGVFEFEVSSTVGKVEILHPKTADWEWNESKRRVEFTLLPGRAIFFVSENSQTS